MHKIPETQKTQYIQSLYNISNIIYMDYGVCQFAELEKVYELQLS